MTNLLLITPKFQLAKFSFLDGEFVFVHFTLQCNSHAGVVLEVVGTCVIVGMDSRVDTLIEHNRLNPTWKFKFSFLYILSCVFFAIICGCSYEWYWYSVECG